MLYSAEMKIRQEVQMFEPLPSHLAYPDILEEYVAHSTGTSATGTTVGTMGSASNIGGRGAPR